MKGRLLILTLALILSCLWLCPVHADSVTYCLDDGSLVIGEAEDEVNLLVEHNGQKTVLSPDTVITVTGRGVTSNTIFIKNNVTVSLILHNVNVQGTPFLKAPLCLDNGETVHLTLIGQNVLAAGDFMAGLQTSGRSTLTVDGAGSLVATGGTDAAGIGGGWRANTPGADAGSITLGGGVKVQAIGGAGSAGIGSGTGGSVKEIVIKSSAQVQATGGAGGAGIGCGKDGNLRRLELAGSGQILATAGQGAAAIGGGEGATVGEITVGGSATVRAYGNAGGAGIGSGKNGTLSQLNLGGEGSLRVQGGEGAAAVGLGLGATGSAVTVNGSVSLYALGNQGAGVGTGKNATLETLTLDQNCQVQAFGSAGAAAVGLAPGASLKELTVAGNAKVVAIGGTEAAGVGGGKGNAPGQITLTGHSSLTALGGLGGAGVGSGFGAPYGPITVSGNTVLHAQGGNYGAGVGSGGREAAETATPSHKILLTDQTNVTAYGGKFSAAIGGGVFGAGSILEISQNAKVVATQDITVMLTQAEASARLISVDAAKGAPLDLSPYLTDPVDPTLAPAIVYSPTPQQFDAAGKSFAATNPSAATTGNGAGCTVMGSTHISGGASLNGLFGDVTLTLFLGEGATDMVITLAKNESYTLPETVTKAGYTFRGWYKDMECTKPVSGKVKLSEDTTYYAGWNAIQVELEEGEITRAYLNVPYSYTFVAAQGSQKTTFSLAQGALPQGLTLSPEGVLSGTPILAGKYPFTVAYRNANGTSGTKEVLLGVYSNLTYVFRLTTGSSNGAGSKAQVMMNFTFQDRFTGEQSTTQTVNVTSLLLNYYDDPLQPGAIVELPLTFESNVGVPTAVNFECNDEDGWFCQSVQVRFDGTAMAEAFEQTFEVNRWYGTNDDNGFWGAFGLTVLILFLVLALLAVAFVLLARYHKPFRTFLTTHGLLGLAPTRTAKEKKK